MSPASKIVRTFISSTVRNLHAARAPLNTVVVSVLAECLNPRR